ncbi:MAG: hypothetical protein ACRBCJ_11150 [Hyphomicrobiaceae bacterium]
MTDQATKSIGGAPATSACSEQQKEDPIAPDIPISFDGIEQSIFFFFEWDETLAEFFEEKFDLPHAEQPQGKQGVRLKLQWNIPLTCNAQTTNNSHK